MFWGYTWMSSERVSFHPTKEVCKQIFCCLCCVEFEKQHGAQQYSLDIFVFILRVRACAAICCLCWLHKPRQSFFFFLFFLDLRSLTSFSICLMNIPLVRAHSTLVDCYGGLFQNCCYGKRWDFSKRLESRYSRPWGSGPGTEAPKRERRYVDWSMRETSGIFQYRPQHSPL